MAPSILTSITIIARDGGSGSDANAAVVAGATIGALSFVALVVAAIIFWRRRSRQLGRRRRLSIVGVELGGRKAGSFATFSRFSSQKEEFQPTSIQFSSVMPSLPSQVSTGPLSSHASQQRTYARYLPPVTTMPHSPNNAGFVVANPTSPTALSPTHQRPQLRIMTQIPERP